MKRKNTFVIHRKRRKRGNMTCINTHDKRKKMMEDGMCQYILIEEEKIHIKQN